MGPTRLEAKGIDRLLSPGRAGDPLSGNPLSGWPAQLLDTLRAGPSPDEVAGEAQAVLSIAALIRSHPVAPPSNLAAVRPSERNRPRSLTERFAARSSPPPSPPRPDSWRSGSSRTRLGGQPPASRRAPRSTGPSGSQRRPTGVHRPDR